LTDGELIESVLIVEKSRKTVCVSTQVGCALKCTFCATGKMGFLRNLSAGEIIEQVWFIKNHFDQGVSNVVFMGMGEPFLNYDFSLHAAKILADDGGMAIAARKITISTSGIIPRIKQYADEGHKFKLAISIHTLDTNLRTRLMPINKKYPLAELVESMKYYTQKTKKRITLEYVLLEGENDSTRDAYRLVELAKLIPCKINILYYNPTDGPHRTPTEEQIQPFIKLITKAPAAVTIRRSKGNDINAACGQLYINHQEVLRSKLTPTAPIRIDISGG
jgi:23S rRNA (adenine2503-C2)-methyltransferase